MVRAILVIWFIETQIVLAYCAGEIIKHGASIQGVYDAHYLHTVEAEANALKRWRGRNE